MTSKSAAPSAGAYIFTWLVGYSALLGPIAGIMICDYWVLRKKHLSVPDLYRMEGAYAYQGGINRWAVYALVLGVLPNVPGFLIQSFAGDIPVDKIVAQFPAGWQGPMGLACDIYSFAWMVGFAVAFFTYWFFMQTFEKANVETDRNAALGVAVSG